jgi:hypothetical protein
MSPDLSSVNSGPASRKGPIMAENFKCARCKIALEGPAKPKPQDRFSCPKCGVGGRYDAIMREVKEYVSEQGQAFLDAKLRDAARRSKFMTFTPASRPKRNHRFIVDMKLH